LNNTSHCRIYGTRFLTDAAPDGDLLSLAKGSLTREEVLLRQSQLATTYRAFLYAGINYTFGSVLNNVVNPRFTGAMSEF
jgi:hypothetical protein